MKKRILCYGDSNTWGYIPGTAERYPEDIRWPEVMAKLLGDEYEVLNEGLSGRTTAYDEPIMPCRNGVTGLGYSLMTCRPFDLVVVMLGTNDLPLSNAYGYYRGLSQLAYQILNASVIYHDNSPMFTGEPKLLLVSPITLHPDIATIKPEIAAATKYPDSCKFAYYTEQVARELNVPWVDAAQVAMPSPVDAVHMEPEGHLAIAKMMADKIREIL